MSCKFLKISGGYASIVCKKFDMDCPYQYWCTKDDKYKVRNCNGKAILHENFADAEKLAIETYKKFEKFNKSFEG